MIADYADYAAPIARPRPRLRLFRRSVLIGATVAAAAAVTLGEVAYGGSHSGPDTVVVHGGDTLWGIASDRYPNDNTSARVQEILSLNRLRSVDIHPGQALVLPGS